MYVTFNFSVSLLHNSQGKDSDIWSYDATSNWLLLLFTCSSWSVALLAFSHEDAHTTLGEDTLSHGETLFVVSTGDSEDVPLELITQGISLNFLAHSAVEKYVALVIVVDFKSLLPTLQWVSDVELAILWLISPLPSYFLKIDLI